MSFNTNDATLSVTGVSRDEAKPLILEMARNEGIEGAFKVFYQGQMISSPDSLPDTVDMGEVSVSAVLDQAIDHWFVDGFGVLTCLSDLR
jgi:hypothetical protein